MSSFSCGVSTRFWVMASPNEASQSHPLDTPHSVGLLWMSDQPDAEIPTSQYTTLTSDRHPCPGGIRNRQRAAADSRLRQRGLRDRQNVGLEGKNCIEQSGVDKYNRLAFGPTIACGQVQPTGIWSDYRVRTSITDWHLVYHVCGQV
jgi:hypothetical protein